ncbi:MAG: hypothetical protein GY755_00085 [Chloroflexi bacterium]|nr:hypothetical protein [Chloroflexota bacterium]
MCCERLAVKLYKNISGRAKYMLDCTFQGQKHGCKDFGLQASLSATPPATTRQGASSFALRATTGQDDPTGRCSLSSYPSSARRPIAFAPSLAFVSIIQNLFVKILKHPPHGMHLVLASRLDPPLPLTSLRARGEMTEIRIQDLRFSLEETAEYMQKLLGKTIEDPIVALMDKKTEG